MKYHKSKNMKKTIIVFMSVLLMGFMLTGCGNSVKKTLCDGGWIIEDKGIDGKLWLYFHEDNTFVFEELSVKESRGKP